MKHLTTTASIAALALLIAAPTVVAETVHTETYVQTEDLDNVNQINFSAFDVNNDGLYAKTEVGKKLFYIFDQDGNEVIDNLEWDRKSVYTIIPMKKETLRFVDYNDDGYTDLSEYSYETFYEESGLIRFDNDKNGLSAAEFIGESFNGLDSDDSGVIEMDEWEEAYIESVRPEVAKQENYN